MVVPAAMGGMEKLKESDGDVPILLVDHPGTKLDRPIGEPLLVAKAGIDKPAVLVVGRDQGLELEPVLKAIDVDPVRSIDVLRVQLGVVQHPPEIAAQDDVRVHVEDPLPSLGIVEPDVDSRSFVKGVSLLGEGIRCHKVYAVFVADGLRLLVVRVSHDHDSVELLDIFWESLL